MKFSLSLFINFIEILYFFYNISSSNKILRKIHPLKVTVSNDVLFYHKKNKRRCRESLFIFNKNYKTKIRKTIIETELEGRKVNLKGKCTRTTRRSF